MNDSNFQFGSDLVENLVLENKYFSIHPDFSVKVQSLQGNSVTATLDLTPFIAKPKAVTALHYFENITTANDLLSAYKKARENCILEMDLPSVAGKISAYSHVYIDKILQSTLTLSEFQVELIVVFIQNLDLYSALKCMESLLNNKADIALLEVAHQKNWHVHFDHLAIRCGNQKNTDAAHIARFLIKEHGYVPSQIKSEAHYQFSDGWNAFPLYKILDNGQVLRLFVDQSDIKDDKQIIQHWNYVYGYTAHHLALRATKINQGQKLAVPLNEVIEALTEHGIKIMQPTGQHTYGLLMQVFAKPERNESIPYPILLDLKQKGNNLGEIIQNGKLLEMVSREEMPTDWATRLYSLYGLQFNPENALHSAPIYTYFLPAQAAHVIKTSQMT